MKTFEGKGGSCWGQRAGTQRGYWLERSAAWAGRSALPIAVGLLCIALALGGCGRESDSARGAANAAASPASAASAAAKQRPVLLFLGDSLTAGFGLTSDQAYPALIQQRIDAAGLDYRVVNAGVSGDTSAGGLRRLDWLLRLPVAVMVVGLGGNDMLRGLDTGALHENLAAILGEARKAHPEVRLVVAGMRAAPNLGPDYSTSFNGVFPAVAEEYDAALIPFLLEGVAGDPSLNQPDGIHPTAEGQRRIAASIWPVIEPVLTR